MLPRVWILTLFLFALNLGQCGFVKNHPLRDRELHQIVTDSAPELKSNEVVVPFEVTAEQTEMALDAVRGAESDLSKARLLLNAIMDESYFGIRWENFITTTAAETIETKRGNCVAIASVYVGLARAIGLDAHFAEVVKAFEESHEDEEYIVSAGHLTAVVYTSDGQAALQMGSPFNFFVFISRLSDVEATAHFYNNRGYEIIHQAKREGRPVDWNQSATYFSIATRLFPDFAQAWNNLGIAHAHLGRGDEAIACYKKAISSQSEFSAAYSNLASVYYKRGNLDDAVALYEQAVIYDDENPRNHYRLGRALIKARDYGRAVNELEIALEFRKDYESACHMLNRAYRQTGHRYQRTCIAKKDHSEYRKSYKNQSVLFLDLH